MSGLVHCVSGVVTPILHLGKMIDVPIVIRARRLLARYEKIVKREKRTLAALHG
jgi:hypothetical protein